MARAISITSNGLSTRPHARGIYTLLAVLFHYCVPLVNGLPVVKRFVRTSEDEDLPKSPEDPTLWVYLGTAIALVLLGGIFAGLTIAYVHLARLVTH